MSEHVGNGFAVVVERAGGPEALVWRERSERPTPGPGELLVQTAAVGLNFIETYQRSGVYPVDYPFTPGQEASGTVIEVGEGVQGIEVGDRVMTCEGKATYASSFVISAEKAAPVPDGISDELAAAIPLQGITAHYLANSSAHPEPGETVLLHAGAGGVGLILTQLLAHRGVNVITTASTDEKRQLSLAAGAAHAIPYEGFRERVLELTDGVGVHVVYDGVGKDTFDDSLASLKPRGMFVLYGGASGQVPPFDLQRLNSGGSLSITRPSIAHFMQSPEERALRYGELLQGVSDGWLTFNIGATYPLSDAAVAHEALESRATTGKTVLTL